MTKRDFIALADTIRTANAEKRSPDRPTFDAQAIDRLARFCQSQNPAFRRQLWLDYIAGKCGSEGGALK